MIKRTIALAIAAGVDGALPTEFRLFVKGWNDTEKGRFLFDDDAAASVMTAYASWGVDLMIDLEHQSLEVEPGAPDPTARDARGWCRLELRNGELWACDVRWTPDGTARLQNKTQRYVSPAFEADPETNRVLQMINIAIVAMPATHNTPALVAASRKELGRMDPKLVRQALEAIEKGDAKAAAEILKNMIAAAAGAEPAADGDEDGSADRGSEGVAPPKTESVEDPKVVNQADDKGDKDDEKDPEKKMSALVRAAVREALSAERTALAAERAARESTDRRALVADLIKLGAEFPATVWVDPLKKDALELKPRWAKMPLAELQSHVAEQRLARGVKTGGPGLQPEKGTPTDDGQDVKLSSGKVVHLTANQVKCAKDANCTLENYAIALAFHAPAPAAQ